MKKILLFLLLALFSTMTAWAEEGDEFIVGNLKYKVTSESPKTVQLNGNDGKMPTGDLVIPATVVDYSVTSIGVLALADCSGLTNIKIPTSVTSIGFGAFSYCTGLTRIEIPTSVTSIGFNPFSGCSGLTSIVVADGNTAYDSRENCNAIIRTSDNTLIAGCMNTIIPDDVTTIDTDAFYYCPGLTSIEIPEGVTSINRNAFYHCTGLTSIEVPTSVKSIDTSAFFRCSGLTSIVVADGNTAYDSRENCNAIIRTSDNTLIAGCKNTIIPISVTSIGNGAFYDCRDLTSIKIPHNVTSIGNGAFQDCLGLTDVYCYANPALLTWKYIAEDCKRNRATKFHVSDASVWRNKFPDANVTFVGDLKPDPTAINGITATDTTDGAWYTLDGVKLDGEPSAPGMYVKDGKKMIIK